MYIFIILWAIKFDLLQQITKDVINNSQIYYIVPIQLLYYSIYLVFYKKFYFGHSIISYFLWLKQNVHKLCFCNTCILMPAIALVFHYAIALTYYNISRSTKICVKVKPYIVIVLLANTSFEQIKYCLPV